MFKKLIIGGAALGVSLAAAIPFVAVASESDCGKNYVCLWRDADFTGGGKFMTSASSSPKVTNLVDFNDVMTSWKNNHGSRDARWFYEFGARGKTRCMNVLTKNRNIGWGESDYASSVVIYTDAWACN